VLETLWDFGGENHPMITSMREHKGHLYLGGISNNRIGRLKLARGNAGWSAVEQYWGRT
jgi:ribose transport system permease protein